MYPYTAGGEGEISVSEGQEVVIVEADGILTSNTPTHQEVLT